MKKLTIIGRVCDDAPKKIETKNGMIGFITIAVSNGKDKEGKDRPSDFFDILVRENVLKYLDKIENLKGALAYSENDISVKNEKIKDVNNKDFYYKKVFVNNINFKVLFTKVPETKKEK